MTVARRVPGVGCLASGLQGKPAENLRSELAMTTSAWTTVAGSSPSAYHPRRPDNGRGDAHGVHAWMRWILSWKSGTLRISGIR
jgi:hypothetical protein